MRVRCDLVRSVEKHEEGDPSFLEGCHVVDWEKLWVICMAVSFLLDPWALLSVLWILHPAKWVSEEVFVEPARLLYSSLAKRAKLHRFEFVEFVSHVRRETTRRPAMSRFGVAFGARECSTHRL